MLSGENTITRQANRSRMPLGRKAATAAVGATTTTLSVDASNGGTGSYVEALTPKDTATIDERLRGANTISSTAITASGTVSTTVHISLQDEQDDDDDAAKRSSGSPSSSPTEAATATAVSLRDLYRYASLCDRMLLYIGLLMMLTNGAMYPVMAILFGEAISSFEPLDMDKIERVALSYFAIAVALFVTDYVAHLCLETTAQKQMHALRIHVFRHVIYQDIAWFETDASAPHSGIKNDTKKPTERPTRSAGNVTSIAHLNTTTTKIKDGIGVKLGEVARCLAQFGTGYAIGFATHWQVSIVMAAVMPFMAISLSWIIKTMRERAVSSHRKYAEAGAVAEETLRNIRTVAAFNGEQRAVDAYLSKAKSAEQENITLARVLSLVLGVFFGSVWVTYAVGLWFGASVVANAGETDPRTVFTAFYGILIGTISLAQIAPNVAAVVAAKAVAASLFKLLNAPSKINSYESVGVVPTEICSGKIEIVDVSFAYPSRPETLVLRNYSLTIHAGETIAFVGPSGGGKSTLMALLQRYYDPAAGTILLDGRELQHLQLKWLRRQIGLVSQEPVLFATTIFENIAASLAYEEHDRTPNHDTIRQRVEAAAKLANAHEFIMALPLKYDTFVGEKGVALSGGQKQRIAIARALIRDPRILILDEATSALDTESEAMIQAALDTIITKTVRTTLIVAHRLSTIKRADRICVVVGGEIVESGSHEELLRKTNGTFQELVLKAHYGVGGSGALGEQRNASLMWCDSLTDMLSSGRGSSVAMLTARSTTDATTTIVDSSRSDLMAMNLQLHAAETGDPPRCETGIDKATEELTDGPDKATSPHGVRMTPTPKTSALVRRLMQHSRRERPLFVVGLVAATLNGLSFPASAVLLSAVVSSMVNQYALFQLSRDQTLLDDMYSDVWQLCMVYIAGGVALLLVSFAQSYAFKIMAEKLTTRLRELHFRALCGQEMRFFDDATHSSGALASELALMPTKAAVLAGDTIGRLTQAGATFVAALLVSFLMGSWQLSLVMCVVFPLLIVSTLIRLRALKGADHQKPRKTAKQDTDADETDDDHTATARADTLASEAVVHIRTVASFGLESKLVDEYRQLSLAPMQRTARHAHANGLALGVSSFTTFAVYALVFYCGGALVQRQTIRFEQLICSLMAIMISASGIGQAAAHVTDVDDATAACSRIFKLEDRRRVATKTTLQLAVPPLSPSVSPANGAIQFENVVFAYPSRPSIRVLRGLNLSIAPGQLVALCGPSGGGKSTIVSLLERFYEPLHGSITLDGVAIHTLSVAWLRSQLGLISQEPVLFAGTIHDNIAYGATLASDGDGAGGAIGRDAVEQAAQLANAHDFITAFPDGYDTHVGGSGSSSSEQLSGGQKQRIAIARAVLKDPAILVLDEATSALDADSEQLVQDALEHLIKSKPRTTIVIAHRLRTIRNADKICVLNQGQIVEHGSHDELLAIPGGLYAKLTDNAHDERLSVMEG